jgi:hypothetical protein
MHRLRNISIAVIVIVVVAAGLLGFTSPGHRVLNALGFATADCGGSGC